MSAEFAGPGDARRAELLKAALDGGFPFDVALGFARDAEAFIIEGHGAVGGARRVLMLPAPSAPSEDEKPRRAKSKGARAPAAARLPDRLAMPAAPAPATGPRRGRPVGTWRDKIGAAVARLQSDAEGARIDAIAAETGIARETLRKQLQQLVGAGVLDASGRGGWRRYRIAEPSAGAPRRRAAQASPPAPPRDSVRGKVMSMIALLAPRGRVTRAALARALDMEPQNVGPHLAALLGAGAIKAEGATLAHHYWPAGSVPAKPTPISDVELKAAAKAGKVTKCPPAYVAPVEGAAPIAGGVPVYAPPVEGWRQQRDASLRNAPPPAKRGA